MDRGADPADLAAARRIVGHRFRFLNQERRLVEIDWSAQYVSALWTYHLHYLDYAVELARAWRETADRRFLGRYVEIWSDWLDAAARGAARIEPYPTSVRCLNALRSLWLVEEELPAEFAARLRGATHEQLAWLANHLERHLRANHLQKNLASLALGSLAFASPEASRWARQREELWSEFREQVLPDGGHFERSPMYHAAALDDFLRSLALCRAVGVGVPADVPHRLEAMTRALQWLGRRDGSLHLLNDAVDGQRPGRNAVVELARSVLGQSFPEPAGAFALADTGYYGHVDPEGRHRFVIDAGPPGPDYQPGHAHCDMLSFELDVHGRRVVVDSGVHGYDGDPYREYVRSTRAHNTVAVDGREQHEMWATFRVARRGEVIEAQGSAASNRRYAFRGACRPYHDRRLVHGRRVELEDGRLTVTDRVERASGRPVASWLHLHPDFRVERNGPDFRAIDETGSGIQVLIETFGADAVAVLRGESDPVQGWHCPEFGLALASPAIELRLTADDGREFGWRLLWT